MIKGLKICGISNSETLSYILNHNYPPKFIGFICNYKKSRRYVSYENLQKLIALKKKDVNFVSVLVNPDKNIFEKIKDFSFHYFLLYLIIVCSNQKLKPAGWGTRIRT